MKTKHHFISAVVCIFVTFVSLLSGCRTLPDQPLLNESTPEFAVELSFPDGAPALNHEATMTVSVLSFVNLHDVQVWVTLPEGLELVSGNLAWTGNVSGTLEARTETEAVKTVVKPTKTGLWTITVHFFFPPEQRPNLIIGPDGQDYYLSVEEEKTEWGENPPWTTDGFPELVISDNNSQ